MISRRTTRARRLRARSALAVVTLALLAGLARPDPCRLPRRSAPQVTYHGGPVEHSSNVYAIFWTPAGYSFPSGYAALVAQYFTDVAHRQLHARRTCTRSPTSTTTDPALRRSSSRTRSRTRVRSSTRSRFRPRPSSVPRYPLGRLVDGHGLPDRQPDREQGEVGDRHAAPAEGNGHQLLPFHAARRRELQEGQVAGGRRLQQPAAVQRVLRVPLARRGRARRRSSTPTCRTPRSRDARRANRRTAMRPTLCSTTSRTSTTSRCPIRSVTAGTTTPAREIADKCHLTFGASRGATATGQYNQVINGHGYWLQQLWSNRAGGCVQRNTFPQPVTTFTHKPTGRDARQEGQLPSDGARGRRVEVLVPLDVPRRRHQHREESGARVRRRRFRGPGDAHRHGLARQPDAEREHHHRHVATDLGANGRPSVRLP